MGRGVDIGDIIKQGDFVCDGWQMKMESAVRAAHTGKVSWVTETDNGQEAGEGLLMAEIEDLGYEGRNEAKLYCMNEIEAREEAWIADKEGYAD